MLVCDAPDLVRWRPDFSSSGQAAPSWTQVLCDGRQLTNGYEWVDWDENPVQVALCEECGVTHCAFGGYVHVSRLGAHVVWTAPRLPVTDDEEYDRHQYATSPAIKAHGGVVIPQSEWAGWPGVPAIDGLPLTRRRDLSAAWRAEAPPREDAIGTDAGSVDEAFAAVAAVERWFESDAPAGELVPLGDGAITIFYESPRFAEWTPVARVGQAFAPVFAGRLVAV